MCQSQSKLAGSDELQISHSQTTKKKNDACYRTDRADDLITRISFIKLVCDTPTTNIFDKN